MRLHVILAAALVLACGVVAGFAACAPCSELTTAHELGCNCNHVSDQASAYGLADAQGSHDQFKQQQEQQQVLAQHNADHLSAPPQAAAKSRRSLLQLGFKGQLSPLLTPMDIIVHHGWDGLGKRAALKAVAGGVGMEVGKGVLGYLAKSASASDSSPSATIYQPTPPSSRSNAAPPPPPSNPSSGGNNGSSGRSGPLGTVADQAGQLVPGALRQVAGGAPALSALAPLAQYAGPAGAPLVGAVTGAAGSQGLGPQSTGLQGSGQQGARQQPLAAMLESGALPLSALQGAEGFADGQQPSGEGADWLAVLQGALEGSGINIPSDGSLLSIVQSIFSGSGSGIQPVDDSNPFLTALQEAFTGNGAQAAGSNPLLTALRKAWVAGQAAEAADRKSQQAHLMQQQQSAGSYSRSNGNMRSTYQGLASKPHGGSSSAQLAQDGSGGNAHAPGQLLLEQGSYGQQQGYTGQQQWVNPEQGSLGQQAQQALLGQQGLLGQQASNLQQGLVGQQALLTQLPRVQQALTGQQGLLRQPGLIGQQATNAQTGQQGLLGQQLSSAQQALLGRQQVPFGLQGVTRQQQQQQQPTGMSQQGQQQQQQQQGAFTEEEMDAYSASRGPPQPWKHKVINRLVQGVQDSIPRDVQKIQEIKGVLKPVKQTAFETKRNITSDVKRTVHEIKRIDNSFKGQLVDIVADSVTRLKPNVTQLVNKTALIQPWADAAQTIMKQKADYVRDFADRVADTDLEFGGELEATFGQAANLTQGLGFNFTGLSSNLAKAVTDGATNFFNGTRNATNVLADSFRPLVQTTTEAAQNTFTSVVPVLGNLVQNTRRIGDLTTTFPREIGTDAANVVRAAVGAVPQLLAGTVAGAAGLVPRAVPWITRGVDLAANTGLAGLQATGTVMHNLAAPLAEGALQAVGGLGSNLLTNGFNKGFDEGLLAAQQRRAPFQDARQEQARAEAQPALYLPSSFAPLGQMMTITYPCPTGNFPGPAGPPAPGVPPVPPPVVPGQPPGAVPGAPVAAGPPSAPIGTMVGPGIPCGVPLYMVPKNAVPRQGKPLPAPMVEYPYNPQATPQVPIPSPIPIPTAPLQPAPGLVAPIVGAPGTPPIAGVAPGGVTPVPGVPPGVPGAPPPAGGTPPGVPGPTPAVPGVPPPAGVTPPGVTPTTPGAPAPGTLPPVRLPPPAPGTTAPGGVVPPGVPPAATPGISPGVVPPIVRPGTTQSLNWASLPSSTAQQQWTSQPSSMQQWASQSTGPVRQWASQSTGPVSQWSSQSAGQGGGLVDVKPWPAQQSSSWWSRGRRLAARMPEPVQSSNAASRDDVGVQIPQQQQQQEEQRSAQKSSSMNQMHPQHIAVKHQLDLIEQQLGRA